MRIRRQLAVAAVVALASVMLALVPGPGASGQGGGISLPPGLPDLGTLTLETEKGQGGTNQFVHRDAGDVVLATQTITSNKCKIGSSGALLAGLATSKGVPGINDGSIGDKTKGPGTNCGRTEAPNDLTLTLAGALAGVEMSSVALDIEVKKNAAVTATAYLDGTASDTFELRTGSSIVPGQGSSVPGSAIYNCSAASDSGPDSGASDNCSWERAVVADTIVFHTDSGEWSLEGGADGTSASVITLTDITGLLDCESQPNAGDFDLSAGTEGPGDDPFAGLVRKDNLDPDEACVLIPVLLETAAGPGGQEVVLRKDLTSQISAAFTIDVEWDVESAADPPPATSFDFELPAVPVFDLQLCVGTPVYDAGGNFDGIAELLDTDPGNDPAGIDKAPAQPGIQYACFFSQQLDLIDEGEIVLRQGIYVIGDWRSFR